MVAYAVTVAALGFMIARDERVGALTLAGLAALASIAVPTWVLLVVAFVVFRWRPEPVLGNLAIADLVLLVYVARTAPAIAQRTWPRWMRSLAGFVLVAWAATQYHRDEYRQAPPRHDEIVAGRRAL